MGKVRLIVILFCLILLPIGMKSSNISNPSLSSIDYSYSIIPMNNSNELTKTVYQSESYDLNVSSFEGNSVQFNPYTNSYIYITTNENYVNISDTHDYNYSISISNYECSSSDFDSNNSVYVALLYNHTTYKFNPNYLLIRYNTLTHTIQHKIIHLNGTDYNTRYIVSIAPNGDIYLGGEVAICGDSYSDDCYNMYDASIYRFNSSLTQTLGITFDYDFYKSNTSLLSSFSYEEVSDFGFDPHDPDHFYSIFSQGYPSSGYGSTIFIKYDYNGTIQYFKRYAIDPTYTENEILIDDSPVKIEIINNTIIIAYNRHFENNYYTYYHEYNKFNLLILDLYNYTELYELSVPTINSTNCFDLDCTNYNYVGSMVKSQDKLFFALKVYNNSQRYSSSPYYYSILEFNPNNYTFQMSNILNSSESFIYLINDPMHYFGVVTYNTSYDRISSEIKYYDINYHPTTPSIYNDMISIDLNNMSVQYSWLPSNDKDGNISRYEILQTYSDNSYSNIISVGLNTTWTSLLQNGVSEFRIRAVDNSNYTSNWSDILQVIITDQTDTTDTTNTNIINTTNTDISNQTDTMDTNTDQTGTTDTTNTDTSNQTDTMNTNTNQTDTMDTNTDQTDTMDTNTDQTDTVDTNTDQTNTMDTNTDQTDTIDTNTDQSTNTPELINIVDSLPISFSSIIIALFILSIKVRIIMLRKLK